MSNQFIFIRSDGQGEWRNYQRTLYGPAIDRFWFAGVRPQPTQIVEWFREASGHWQALLELALSDGRDLRPMGGKWSYTQILSTEGNVAYQKGMDAIFRLPDDNGRRLVLAAGGTTINDLNSWLRKEGLSLRTSGASNGQTIAGAIATGTHGSVPTIGGIQDHVLGLQLIGGPGPGHNWWLERYNGQFLSDDFLQAIGATRRPNPADFESVLVHLGGMGIVNAVLLDVDPIFTVEVIRRQKRIDEKSISALEVGDFRGFACGIDSSNCDRTPYFLQVILNPFKPWGTPALFEFRFRSEGAPASQPVLYDEATTLFSKLLGKNRIGSVPGLELVAGLGPLALIADVIDRHPYLAAQIVPWMMRKAYPKDSQIGCWADFTPAPVHDGLGTLYTASIAIARTDLRKALKIMVPAFQEATGGSFVLTLRFVAKSLGHLAFTRFENNAVIDMDGLENDHSQAAGQRIFHALAASDIHYSHHWGKIGRIGKLKLAQDYGQTTINGWKTMRQQLLDDRMNKLFYGKALSDWGLV